VERTESDGVAFVTVRIVGVESKVAELAEMAPIPKGEMITSVLEKLVSKMLMLPGAVIRDDKAGIELVIVKGGEFTMGCTAEQGRECLDNEKPARKATLGDFYIGKYEVTQKQWVEVMGSNPSHFKGDDLPVESVSWMEVQEFISKLRQITGRRYRLPTEAEWEYAARGGQSTKNFMYSGGNHADETAWYIGNSGEKTHAVGTKDPNELGIYDMSGNVWEWVADWYGKYSAAAQENPSGPSAGANRVFRGGGWSGEAWYCRVSGRFNYTPIIRYHSLGFRLALTP
jgi:formylglycine-generating enzyme required for sulfatase activity